MKNIALTLVYLFCAVTLQSQASTKLADIVDNVRPSVVQIAIRRSIDPNRPFAGLPQPYNNLFTNSPIFILGTGMFVNSNGDVVTALHVADGYIDKNGQQIPGARQILDELSKSGIESEIVIGVSLPNVESTRINIAAGTSYYSADIATIDASHDLALIRPRLNPFTHMRPIFGGPDAVDIPKQAVSYVTFSVARPKDAEEIFACGFPLSQHGLVTTLGYIASAWNSRVLLRAEAAGFNYPTEMYIIDLRINPGNSGGPVFKTSDHSVIGTAVESFGNLGIVVPAKFITAFLTSSNIPWTDADFQTTPQKSLGK